MTRLRDDLVWLAPAVSAGLVVYAVYLATNPYPAQGAGLYLAMARVVSEHGYALPRTIPHYTPGGIPFAYPPLAIYAVALLRDATGIAPLALSRWLPGPVVVASAVPTYFLARDLLDSRPGAGVAATLVAVNPQLLDWHLTAGGLVRAPAFLFTATGLYAGVQLFGSETSGPRSSARTREWRGHALPEDRRWLGLAVACFLATLLTHPTYAVFYGVSYLVFFLGSDRSLAGFAHGAVVAVGSVALAAPWWLAVVRAHGFDVFLGAAGTHGGVGGGVIARLATVPPEPVVVLLTVLLAGSVLAGLALGRVVLATWLVSVSFVLGQPRFALFVATFLVVALLLDAGRRVRATGRPSTETPTIDRPSPGRLAIDPPPVGRGGPVIVLVLAVVLGALVGAGYVRDDTAAPRQSITPDSVERADLAAMEWTRSATTREASFVVLGDASEWFPYFARRTLLVSPWGAEWEGSRTYARHLDRYRTVSRCDAGACLTAALSRGDRRPDYVYVPKGTYPVQGTPHRSTGSLVRDLERSDRYRLAFENRGVAIFRVRSRPAVADPGGSGVEASRPRHPARTRSANRLPIAR